MPAYSTRLRLLVSALLTLLVVIAATALARQVTSAEPAVTLNLPRTGQTVCYDAGGMRSPAAARGRMGTSSPASPGPHRAFTTTATRRSPIA